MYALECHHVLPNGQKCRGAALRESRFCRHHALVGRPFGPPPPSRRDRHSSLARWRSLGRSAPWLDPEAIPQEILGILFSLLGRDGEDSISPLTAGRCLRALLQRLGHVPFTLPDPDGATLPGPVPLAPPPSTAPSAPGARRPVPVSLPPALSPASLRAACAEAFPDGLPRQGEPADPERLDRALRVLAKHGLVPPRALSVPGAPSLPHVGERGTVPAPSEPGARRPVPVSLPPAPRPGARS